MAGTGTVTFIPHILRHRHDDSQNHPITFHQRCYTNVSTPDVINLGKFHDVLISDCLHDKIDLSMKPDQRNYIVIHRPPPHLNQTSPRMIIVRTQTVILSLCRCLANSKHFQRWNTTISHFKNCFKGRDLHRGSRLYSMLRPWNKYLSETKILRLCGRYNDKWSNFLFFFFNPDRFCGSYMVYE